MDDVDDLERLERTLIYLADTSPGAPSELEPAKAFSVEAIGRALRQQLEGSGDLSNEAMDMESAVSTTSVFVDPPHMREQALNSFEDAPLVAQAVLMHLHDKYRSVKRFTPTDVQKYVYPFLKERKHVLVRSPTGSGKTLAFLLPVMEAVLRGGEKRSKSPRAIILTDTRDLCEQHAQTATSLQNYLSASLNLMLTVSCYVGGDRTFSANSRFHKVDSDIICISPGRLMGFINDKKIDLSNLTHIIVDEADEIFFGGKFLTEMSVFKEELQRLRGEKKTFNPCVCLLSATLLLPDLSRETSRGLEILLGAGNHPVPEEVGYVEVVYHESRIQQRVIRADSIIQKLSYLTQLMEADLQDNGATKATQFTHRFKYTTIIFADTRKMVMFLAAFLSKRGFFVKMHMGRMADADKRRNRDWIDKGKLPFLITTNALARGLDKPNIKHVILFELPATNWHTYTHRVGRTGRGLEPGKATILFDSSRGADLQKGPALVRTLVLFNQPVPKFLLDAYGNAAFPTYKFVEVPINQTKSADQDNVCDMTFPELPDELHSLIGGVADSDDDDEDDEDLCANMLKTFDEEEFGDDNEYLERVSNCLPDDEDVYDPENPDNDLDEGSSTPRAVTPVDNIDNAVPWSRSRALLHTSLDESVEDQTEGDITVASDATGRFEQWHDSRQPRDRMLDSKHFDLLPPFTEKVGKQKSPLQNSIGECFINYCIVNSRNFPSSTG